MYEDIKIDALDYENEFIYFFLTCLAINYMKKSKMSYEAKKDGNFKSFQTLHSDAFITKTYNSLKKFNQKSEKYICGLFLFLIFINSDVLKSFDYSFLVEFIHDVSRTDLEKGFCILFLIFNFDSNEPLNEFLRINDFTTIFYLKKLRKFLVDINLNSKIFFCEDISEKLHSHINNYIENRNVTIADLDTYATYELPIKISKLEIVTAPVLSDSMSVDSNVTSNSMGRLSSFLSSFSSRLKSTTSDEASNVYDL